MWRTAVFGVFCLLNENFVFFEINYLKYLKEISMDAAQKLKGPATYFPSIEKKYGQPIEHWIKLVQKQKDKKHMEVVNWLKGLIHA